MIDPIAFVNLYGLFNLGLAIAEAVILSRNTDAKSECGPEIWICILVLCIFRFLGTAVQLKVQKSQNLEEGGVVRLDFSVGLGLTFFLGIWSVYAFHATSSECKALFQDKYLDLWKLIMAEAISFYIVLGILVLWGLHQRRYVLSQQ